ncbi:MAG: MBL fold metallo-hydrolase, partial [Candidatus Woesearchaeota archaeon]
MAKLIFLGTGGDDIVIGKQMRASGGIALEIDSNLFLLDPGPGTLVRAKQFGINLRNMTALLLSNNTIERSNDLNAVISAMTHKGLDPKGVLICPKTVVEKTSEKSSLPSLRTEYNVFLERVISLEKGDKVGINEIDITAISAKNKEETIGYRIKSKDVSIVYSSDTDFDKNLIPNYNNADILILNVPFPGDSGEIYLNSEKASDIIRKTSPRITIITSFGIKMLNSDPLYEAREIHKKTGEQIIAATDGLVINTSNYSG